MSYDASHCSHQSATLHASVSVKKKKKKLPGDWSVVFVLPLFSRSAAQAPLLQWARVRDRRGVVSQQGLLAPLAPFPALSSSVVLLRAKGSQSCYNGLMDGNLKPRASKAYQRSEAAAGTGSGVVDIRERSKEPRANRRAGTDSRRVGADLCDRAGLRGKTSLLVTLTGLRRDLALNVMAGCSKKRYIGTSSSSPFVQSHRFPRGGR